MRQEESGPRIYQFSHMLILVSYTILVVALIGESFLLEWETWPLVPIGLSVILCWMLHIRKSLADSQRLWVYALAMMGTFFFYGNHVTSTYDLAMIIVAIIMLFTTSGMPGLVRLAMVTYYLTLAFDLYGMVQAGTQWDGLLVTRTMLHICMVFMAGWLAQIIIQQWTRLFHQSDEQLASLNAASRRMNVFMANLSHELRTPLNAILGITSGLMEKAEADECQSDLQTVLAAGRRMEVQTDDILNYSELATGSLVVGREPCALPSILGDLANTLRPVMPANLELVFDVDPGVPAVVITDVGKLKKILWHLVSNSLKYTKQGGACVRISCARQSYGINLLLEVADTGVGMTEEEMESVFRQLYEANSGHGTRLGGLGIGLCITGGFVRALGGFMTAESQVGVGTTVSVSLPMGVEDDCGCMALQAFEGVVVGTYLDLLQFPDSRVREYYYATIKNIVRGTGVAVHQANNLDELSKMVDAFALTHLFVGEEGYRSDPARMEELAQRMVVTVVARDASVLVPDSRTLLMRKPFYCFPVISALGIAPGEEHGQREAMRCPGVHALVVDDEPMNLQVAVNVLHRYGMDVTTASSGPEAVALCAQTAFDIVFMDHMMPEMDGLEATRRIRMEGGGKYNYIPIVMLTANTLSASREQFGQAGFDGFISKPIDLPVLERVLKRVLPATAIRYEAVEKRRAPSSSPSQAEEPSSGPALAASLEALGVDCQEGLRYCQGDEAFYREILSHYAGDAPAKAQDLARFYEARDFPNYAIVVHALKSTSKMIGAEPLFELAQGLEEASKREDAQRMQRQHPTLMRSYAELADGIRSLIGAEEGGEGADEEILEFLPDGGDEQ